MKGSALFKGEEILLQRQVGCSRSRDGTWKAGYLQLTNEKLSFSQPYKGGIFQSSLEDVIDVGIEVGKFVLGVKKRLLYLWNWKRSTQSRCLEED